MKTERKTTVYNEGGPKKDKTQIVPPSAKQREANPSSQHQEKIDDGIRSKDQPVKGNSK